MSIGAGQFKHLLSRCPSHLYIDRLNCHNYKFPTSTWELDEPAVIAGVLEPTTTCEVDEPVVDVIVPELTIGPSRVLLQPTLDEPIL